MQAAPARATAHPPAIGVAPISTAEFAAFRRLIARVAGIHMSDAKKQLVEARLSRRLRHYGYRTFRRYYEHLKEQDPRREELREMVNCITTNKTSFFREPHHFEFLKEHLGATVTAGRRVDIWSAGCSSGQEPYSIAMTAARAGVAESVGILASDVDTRMLEVGREGVYRAEEIEALDSESRAFFLAGRGESERLVRTRPELRSRVDFQHLNLNAGDWGEIGPFDVIFCRNVIIYFNRETQRTLLRRFMERLRPGGYLLLGHSENIQWYTRALVPRGDTIYRFEPENEQRPSGAARPSDGPPPSREPIRRKTVRIEAGDVHASKAPTEVRTVLGSCISVCLFDPVARTGGMNHFMLPVSALDDGGSGRYGVNAMELLINKIMRLGGERSRLRAKVFGGAQVLRMQRTTPPVATQNIDFVRRFMSDESIPLDNEKLGGKRPLEVRMQTDTGLVLVRALDSNMMDDVVADEMKRTSEVVRKDAAAREDDVTLF